MGKTTGFLEYSRVDNMEVPVEKRVHNFYEFHVQMGPEARMEQAARCMNCGVPLCQSAVKLSGMVTGCPLHNLIPEWNDQLYAGHMEEAFHRLHKTNNFPEFTGRVCPALCEKACICGEYGDPVTAHENELFIVENAYEQGYVRPEIPAVRSGKKVAVIGSGPSGLAVADELNHRGHSVTVFERDDRIGGLLMYGIPNMKLDKDVIARRQKLMETEGVVFRTGVDVGGEGEESISPDEIMKDYDAVVLCCGAKEPRRLGVRQDEMDIDGVWFAVDFLKYTTRQLLKSRNRTSDKLLSSRSFHSAKGKNVVVVGGGDTGNDCIGTCIRQGCKSLVALEIMPEPPLVRADSNPWPEWPKVKKIDYGHEEAIRCFGKDPRRYNTTVKELITDRKGALKKIRTVEVKSVNRKFEEIPGTEKTIPCELLLVAAGFTGCQTYTAGGFGVSLTQRNTVEGVDGTYHTSRDKVFTAGDMHRGQSLVVWAIAEGRACAREVDEYLMGYSTM